MQVQGSGGATAALFRERAYLQTSGAALDDVLGQAHASAQQLAAQRGLMGDMASKLGTLGVRFPVLNSAIAEIKRKRSRDTIILTAVVGVCTLALLAFR